MIYQIALTAAISQMLFFAGYLFFARIPAKPLFDRYKKSCRIMACAILLLAINYSVHDFIDPRFNGAKDWAIWMNLSTYFCEIWLFYSSLMMLLDVSFEQRFWFKALSAVLVDTIYIGLSFVFMFCSAPQHHWLVLIIMCVVFLPTISIYGVKLSRGYRQAVQLFDATHSDDISAYVHWMSIIVYWAIFYGALCGLFTFLPDQYVWIWVVSSIPFYIYIFVSYQGYLVFYEEVETLLEEDVTEPQVTANDSILSEELSGILTQSIDRWVAERKYTEPGLTLTQVARDVGTNRTYLTNYIHQTYQRSFREWVNNLRVNHAKQLMMNHPELTLSDIATQVGYTSLSLFTRTFSSQENTSPSIWRKKARLIER